MSHGGSRVLEIAQSIAAGAPDVVVYPELGMDATTFALAALRLAPVQCAGWGHPVTSGLPTIDAMFTSGPMEPSDGDTHYRERLVRLPGIGTRYARPSLPERASRAALGLPDRGPLLLFPQSLFKLHPADDRRVARVLAAAPEARVVAFAGRHPRLTAKWRARLDPVLDFHGVAPARARDGDGREEGHPVCPSAARDFHRLDTARGARAVQRLPGAPRGARRRAARPPNARIRRLAGSGIGAVW